MSHKHSSEAEAAVQPSNPADNKGAGFQARQPQMLATQAEESNTPVVVLDQFGSLIAGREVLEEIVRTGKGQWVCVVDYSRGLAERLPGCLRS